MSLSRTDWAGRILPLVDLTDLSDTCTNESITNLYASAHTPFGSVASLCIWPEFVSFARELSDTFPIACVINFPLGQDSHSKIISDLRTALDSGATEIDIVHDYRLFLTGDESQLGFLIESAKDVMSNYPNTILKVILEVGELTESTLISRASQLSISAGADFIKTSTGKVPVNATLPASEIMLREISASDKKIGFKAAGGIKTVDDARSYIELAENIMGESYITPSTFRFGASSLLQDVLSVLEGKVLKSKESEY